MAHSSGGGSHGGGSHGGGSHSSHSGGSHSSHSGGSHGGGRSHICSRTPRAGCNKYIYYDKHRHAHFIWCNYDPGAKMGWTRLLVLPFYLVFLAAIIPLFVGSVYIPTTISKSVNPDNTIVVEDNIGVIKDTTALTQALTVFYDETGVTPAVVTVHDSEWIDHYDSLEIYALSQYYYHFTDECHWLIVYSEPDSGFNDWTWEGIIGDDVGASINDNLCTILTDTLQANLYRDISVDEAISRSFTSLLDERKPVIVWETLGMGIVILIFLVIHALFMTGILGGARRYKGAQKVSESVQIIKCNYCDGTYGSDVTLSCPHCGAPVNTEWY